MTNNFEKMMETMMASYMEKAMEAMMAKMFAGMMPEVAPAEVEAPVAKPKSVNTLSREDFLAIAEEDDEPVATPKELDFVVYGSRTARYNGYVPSDIWTVNHLVITRDWKGRWSKKNGGYVFNTPAELRNFLMNYRIKTKLDDNDRHNIKVYKAERAKAKAEYYAKKAEEASK